MRPPDNTQPDCLHERVWQLVERHTQDGMSRHVLDHVDIDHRQHGQGRHQPPRWIDTIVTGEPDVEDERRRQENGMGDRHRYARWADDRDHGFASEISHADEIAGRDPAWRRPVLVIGGNHGERRGQKSGYDKIDRQNENRAAHCRPELRHRFTSLGKRSR